MRSSIKIDFIDRGTGVGIEPVIRIELKKSEDPRDTLISTLFESLREQSYLQLYYSNCRQAANASGLPDMEKQILLFKPEVDTNELMKIVRLCFLQWITEEKYVRHAPAGALHKEETYIYGDTIRTEGELFRQFLSQEGTHLFKNS